MDTFRAAHASGHNWEETGEACMAQLGSIPAYANLGFLYVTDILAPQLTDILDFFRQETGVEHWVGGVGMGICGTGQEYYDQPAIAVMAADFPEDSFHIFPAIRSGLDEFVRNHKSWYQHAAPRFGILHGDPRNQHIPDFLEALSREIVDGFFVGGLTSSRNTNLQIAHKITKGGISGVLFTDRISVTTALTQGCVPIGAGHVITECERNIAIRIDDRPALDVFKQEIGGTLTGDLAAAGEHIFIGRSIKGSDTGDYMVRNLVGFDPENKLLAIGDTLNPGDQIFFCHRDKVAAYEDLLRMLYDIKERMHRPPKGGVYFSCLGRGHNLFGENSEELRIIMQELGDFPLVGFFANGEISHNRLYGYTGVLTLFS